LNYCQLNTFDILYSFKTKEMCNTYIYNEKKHIDKLKNFNYVTNDKLNFIGSKIEFLMDNNNT
jgi:hypothetical protein